MTSTAITTAFIPVRDPLDSARWYADAFGLDVVEATEFSSVLAGSAGQVTLMGPVSGIQAEPGLPWATCSFGVGDVASARERFAELGAAPSEVMGDPARVVFFTATDPDGNTLLVTDR
ncbi:VOC family protein [Microbacterium jejuense]|uniref:VOC family protein n=1 Tax=Microbacterium jejuense TaxID=1263637 RepID=A0ABS7HUG3_9MICO|nr:VOC family protein [Microbacterium jejuense]MBW9095528.1 VOC family protein [Microbacterium jejuense]